MVTAGYVKLTEAPPGRQPAEQSRYRRLGSRLSSERDAATLVERERPRARDDRSRQV
jgi:hypothetical protein